MITYNDYLPDLLGKNALPAYTGYNPTVDPAIVTEFSTVAFRFGHSLLSNQIQRQDNNGNAINDPAGASINLAFDFFDPTLLNPTPTMDPMTGQTSTDIDPILKGDADGNSQAMDLLAINEIRNLLFANGAAVNNGQDLIARDIQRARDDGIGTYNQVREAFGLPPVTSFAQITSNVTVQNELKAAYGTVDQIDPFIGGLAEDHVPGSDLGPLFQAALVDQFTRLRSGDRYFYLNEKWTQDEVNILNQAPTLGKVIEANTGVTNLQADVFTFTASISGTVLVQDGRNDPPGNAFGHGLAGVTVQLQDTSGDVLATTTTDKHGNYTFTQQSGPSNNPEIAYGVSATGEYEIVPILPSYLRFTSPSPITVDITRGGLTVAHQDVGVGLSLTGGGLDGDGNGDGFADIVVGAGAGGGPAARVFSGANPAIKLSDFIAYNTNFTGGVRVAMADVDGDGFDDIITAPGAGGAPDLRVFDFATLAQLDEFMNYAPSFLGGVFVGSR
jgi:hypothetical protein